MQYARGFWKFCSIDQVPESISDDRRRFLVVDNDWNLLTGWQEMVFIRRAARGKNNKIFETTPGTHLQQYFSMKYYEPKLSVSHNGSTHKGFGMLEFPVLLRKLKICFTFTFFSGSKFWPPFQQRWSTFGMFSSMLHNFIIFGILLRREND